MTYRISIFVLALLITGFAAPHAEAKIVHVSVLKGERAPTCEVRATKKRITSGQTTTLVWKSKHAHTMYGITKDGEWEADGRQKIAIGFTGTKEFPMVFVGKGGIATCVAKVFVHPKKD